jgi:hypothetical protein
MRHITRIFESFDLSAIKSQLEGKVGGNIQDDKTKITSFEGLEKVFDLIPLELTESANSPEMNDLVGLLIDKDRIDFLKAYVEKEAKVVNQIANDLKPIFTPKDELNFARSIQAYTTVSQRLLKIHNLMSPAPAKANESRLVEELNPDEDTKKKMEEIARVSKESLANSYAKIFNIQAKNIESIPETGEGADKLESLIELLSSLGVLSLVKEEAAKKKSRMPKEESLSTKKKKRISVRLLRAIAISQLPAISNQQIDKPGDYFRLFKSLESQNPAWMDLSIEKYVFGGNAKEVSDFNATARGTESATEENQINYLRANRSWILSYIKSDKDGTLTDKEENNYVSQLETTCTEKEKEIKNYYLSRDFNISNVSGIQIKPEIKLPLYSKVRLAVSESDRLKESPLRNIVGGALAIVGGLFSRIEDKVDSGALAASKARNEAIFKGISAIAKGTVTLVGGKQAGRDYEAGLEKISSKLNPERITLSQDERKGRVKEDMIATTDATGYAPVNPEAPGQFMQTPNSMAGTMDTFSLLGPGKKSEAKKKSKTAGSKVLTFADFIDSKSKVD